MNEPGTKAPRKSSEDRFRWSDWLKIFLSAVGLAFLITHFIVSVTVVEGASMRETLQDQDRLFVWKFGMSIDNLERGDLIVFHAPDAKGKDYIKRVIALPNEFVRIEDGQVYINGEKLDEPYIHTPYTHTSSTSEWLVGNDEVFVLGDNRELGASKDSRVFGPVPGKLLVGHAVFRLFPFQSMGGL